MPPSPFRPQRGRFRDRLGFALAIVLLIAVPVGISGWLVAAQLEARDRNRVDARLDGALRIAQAALAVRLADADEKARALARKRTVQRAILEGDAKALGRATRDAPALVIYAGGERLAGDPPSGAIVRSVAVLDPEGRPLGRVGIAVALNDDLLRSLGRRAGTMLAAMRGDRVIAGFGAADRRLDLGGSRHETIDLAERRFRIAAVSLPGANARLLAGVPAAELEAATAERTRNVALAALATFLALVLFAEALIPIVRRKFRRSAADDDESIELLGSALAAAHDRAALLPVILETMVEATGAVGGALVEGDNEISAVGERSPLAEPLRVTLAGENGSEAIALLYPPFGGFGEIERRRAERLAAQASVAVEHARQHAIARREATTDPLTGLANRRRFVEQLAAEASRRSRSGRPVALVVADLDDFKQVNDRHGHEAGDEVLKAFARVLRKTLRDIDLPARLGGEEFAVLLPETDGDGAIRVAERLREQLEDLALDVAGTKFRVTASFGVSACPPVERVEDLPAAADEALYGAKSEGKNRVVEGAKP